MNDKTPKVEPKYKIGQKVLILHDSKIIRLNVMGIQNINTMKNPEYIYNFCIVEGDYKSNFIKDEKDIFVTKKSLIESL